MKLTHPVSSAPLALFRVILGLLLFVSVLRFWIKGWIEDLYITPHYFFNYYGFEFVKPLGEYTYWLFAFCGISALMVAIGYRYRLAIVTLFLSFTYIELIDKSTYLNHYYFVSLLLFLMIFLPANCRFSVDVQEGLTKQKHFIPRWTMYSLKSFITVLYVFAGMAKLNSDWLLNAQPLSIWLPAKNDTFLIGSLFNHKQTAFAFSWLGCLYDLFIAFLLWSKRTFWWAYAVVIIFHMLTAVLFPIGMFPYIMIGTAFIFCPSAQQQQIINFFHRLFRLKDKANTPFNRSFPAATKTVLVVFFVFNLLFPWRYLLYPGELFWTEEGFRFSWRVMLIEKQGYAIFTVKDKNGKLEIPNNSDFLTPLQEKMMATQPDMIIQYAHILAEHYRKLGFDQPEVYCDAYVSLNGRLGRSFTDTKVDLCKVNDSFTHKTWILPLNDEIRGL